MSADLSIPRVELKVNNFGPIAEAKVDLRPLTVFVGPSNTGKSYLAILIYSLHNVLQPRPFGLFRGRHGRALHDEMRMPSAGRAELAASEMSRETAVESAQWLTEEIFSSRQSRTREVKLSSIPIGLEHAVRDVLTGAQPQYADSVQREVARSFGLGADLSSLVRHGSGGPARAFLQTEVKSRADYPGSFVHELHFGQPDTRYETTISKNLTIPFAFQGLGHLVPFVLDGLPAHDAGDGERAAWLGDTILTLSDYVLGELSGPLSKPAYYLPADRTGVMHAHNVVVGALLDSAPYAGIRERRSNATMTGVLADFLREMMEIGEVDVRTRRGGGEAVASQIELEVLQGAVKSDRTDAGHPTFSYQPEGWSTHMPLSRTSSMVSELAPVVMYLRHLVEPGDTIIIEEPESHLHPAAQAEFACHLARLVKSGIRVVITTHSNWIVDQIANLVRMSDLQSGYRSDLPGHDAALVPQDVGVWLFEEASVGNGSFVKEISFDPDGVGYEPGYFGIADKQYNTWAEINNLLADEAPRG